MHTSNVPTKETLEAATSCGGCLFNHEATGRCTVSGGPADYRCRRYQEHHPDWEVPTEVAKGFEKFSEQAAQQSAEGRGLRFNAGKVRVDLVPPDAIWALAQLMTVNSHKYPDRNWEKGMPISEVLASCERHLLALKAGEDIDPTDNQPHAVKIMWNGMALTSYLLRGIGTDDRVKFPLPEQRPLPEVIG